MNGTTMRAMVFRGAERALALEERPMSVPGSGRTHSTIAQMRARGVKYWPAPDLVSVVQKLQTLEMMGAVFMWGRSSV